jgi:hypothetical protein
VHICMRKRLLNHAHRLRTCVMHDAYGPTVLVVVCSNELRSASIYGSVGGKIMLCYECKLMHCVQNSAGMSVSGSQTCGQHE